jgi:hypothetical protein
MILRALTSRLATARLPDDDPWKSVLFEFNMRTQAMDAPRVLELGTARSVPTRSTRHDEWVQNASEFIGTDIEAGADVDVVADVHRLSDVFGHEQFDVVISCSTFEHFKYPHLAAHEILKVLKVDGLLFVQTHQTFPLHSHPHDYYRFSTDALVSLFSPRMGFEVLRAEYERAARTFSRREPQLSAGFSYLNVCMLGAKRAPTPEEYEYDLP